MCTSLSFSWLEWLFNTSLMTIIGFVAVNPAVPGCHMSTYFVHAWRLRTVEDVSRTIISQSMFILLEHRTASDRKGIIAPGLDFLLQLCIL